MDVARQEMIVAINGLMDRWPNLAMDRSQPEPRFVGLEQRGMTAVPVRLK
jgi:cytochrome P450